jgi:hypothetical protein
MSRDPNLGNRIKTLTHFDELGVNVEHVYADGIVFIFIDLNVELRVISRLGIRYLA